MAMGKWHEYIYICMCITVIEVIISEILLEKNYVDVGIVAIVNGIGLV